MSSAGEKSPGEFLSRWSRRKLEARAERSERVAEVPALPEQPPAAAPAGIPGVAEETPPAAIVAESLQAIDTLTPESDFRPFLQDGVPPHLKNLALKALFKDPHYNVMDGLDTYIADYSQSDPIPSEMLAKMSLDNLFVRFQPEIPPVAEGQGDAAAAPVAAPGVEVAAIAPSEESVPAGSSALPEPAVPAELPDSSVSSEVPGQIDAIGPNSRKAFPADEGHPQSGTPPSDLS